MRFLAALLCLLAALPAAAQDLPTVGGTAAYRERIALPPDAVLEAELQDVSRADAPAIVLGRFRAGPAGQVPIPFAIPYDPARIGPYLGTEGIVFYLAAYALMTLGAFGVILYLDGVGSGPRRSTTCPACPGPDHC